MLEDGEGVGSGVAQRLAMVRRKHAARASSEFGPTASEAKAAWAVVEEINDSLDAPAAALPGLDQDCVVAALEKCREFDAAMASLEKSLAAMK